MSLSNFSPKTPDELTAQQLKSFLEIIQEQKLPIHKKAFTEYCIDVIGRFLATELNRTVYGDLQKAENFVVMSLRKPRTKRSKLTNGKKMAAYYIYKPVIE